MNVGKCQLPYFHSLIAKMSMRVNCIQRRGSRKIHARPRHAWIPDVKVRLCTLCSLPRSKGALEFVLHIRVNLKIHVRSIYRGRAPSILRTRGARAWRGRKSRFKIYVAYLGGKVIFRCSIQMSEKSVQTLLIEKISLECLFSNWKVNIVVLEI